MILETKEEKQERLSTKYEALCYCEHSMIQVTRRRMKCPSCGAEFKIGDMTQGGGRQLHVIKEGIDW